MIKDSWVIVKVSYDANEFPFLTTARPVKSMFTMCDGDTVNQWKEAMFRYV